MDLLPKESDGLSMGSLLDGYVCPSGFPYNISTEEALHAVRIMAVVHPGVMEFLFA
mgnify:CR=1 FL=1